MSQQHRTMIVPAHSRRAAWTEDADMTLEELKVLAIQAGFGDKNDSGLSGNSDFDEELYIEEYPCGEAVLALAKLLGIEVTP